MAEEDIRRMIPKEGAEKFISMVEEIATYLGETHPSCGTVEEYTANISKTVDTISRKMDELPSETHADLLSQIAAVSIVLEFLRYAHTAARPDLMSLVEGLENIARGGASGVAGSFIEMMREQDKEREARRNPL